jgi:putative endonuclease
MQKQWYVYILKTINNQLYTGITVDVERRFQEHLTQKVGAKYLKKNRPKEILFIAFFKNRSLASKREAEIKKLSRIQKEELIQSSHNKIKQFKFTL